jgi:hypothetical protein
VHQQAIHHAADRRVTPCGRRATTTRQRRFTSRGTECWRATSTMSLRTSHRNGPRYGRTRPRRETPAHECRRPRRRS